MAYLGTTFGNYLFKGFCLRLCKEVSGWVWWQILLQTLWIISPLRNYINWEFFFFFLNNNNLFYRLVCSVLLNSCLGWALVDPDLLAFGGSSNVDKNSPTSLEQCQNELTTCRRHTSEHAAPTQDQVLDQMKQVVGSWMYRVGMHVSISCFSLVPLDFGILYYKQNATHKHEIVTLKQGHCIRFFFFC